MEVVGGLGYLYVTHHLLTIGYGDGLIPAYSEVDVVTLQVDRQLLQFREGTRELTGLPLRLEREYVVAIADDLSGQQHRVHPQLSVLGQWEVVFPPLGVLTVLVHRHLEHLPRHLLQYLVQLAVVHLEEVFESHQTEFLL